MENTKCPTFIEEFSDYLSGIKNFSSVYIKNLTVTLRQFLVYINIYTFNNRYDSIENLSLNDIREINNSDIYSFIFFLAERNYKQSSRRLKIEHLRTFFDYLYRIRHNLFKEPFKKIKREKDKSLELPNYLSLGEAKKLLNKYSQSSTFCELRDNLILHLGLNCGLRVSEMSNLNISDFDLNNDSFLVFGKGSKERKAYLNAAAKDALLKYLDVRNQIKTPFVKDKDCLLLTKYFTKLKVRDIQKAIKKAYYSATIDEKVYSAHTLRHTCATLLYKSGVDIKIIKEILGHVRIDTTEIYTHLHDEEVLKALFNHPLSKFKMKDALEFMCA